MKIHNSNKSIWALLVMCSLMCVALILIGIFSYVLRGWLMWDFNRPFPFGKNEIIIILKISLLGIPMGLVFWIFGIR